MATGKGISEITEITTLTGSDLFLITDDSTGNSRRVTWDNILDNLYLVGDFYVSTSSSVTPTNNGDLVVEATNNTTLTFKLKGTDGTVRSGTITLS